jgi:hypothetical protein
MLTKTKNLNAHRILKLDELYMYIYIYIERGWLKYIHILKHNNNRVRKIIIFHLMSLKTCLFNIGSLKI